MISDLKVNLEIYKEHAAKMNKRGPRGNLEMKSVQLAAYIAMHACIEPRISYTSRKGLDTEV